MRFNQGCKTLYLRHTRDSLLAGLFMTSGLVWLPSEAKAEDENAVFQLGTITVYGQQLSPSDALESQIDSATINLLEKKNVAEALSMTPGVTFLEGAGGRNESFAMVRGFGSVSVPVYIDGIPAYVPYDGNLDLSRFTTADIASIHVAKGYSSVLYGPNAIGGAINILSRKPVAPFEGDVTLGAFTGKGKEASFNLGSRQEYWYTQLGASRLERDYYKMAKRYQGTRRRNYQVEDWKVSAKIGYIPNETDEYTIGYQHQEAEKGYDPHADGYVGTAWRWPKWNRKTIYAVSNTRIGDASYIKPRVYYDKFDNSLLMPRYNGDTSSYDDYSWGGSLELGTERITDNSLKGVVHYKLDNHREMMKSKADSHHYNDYTYEDRNLSFGLEDTWHITPQWDLQFGLSYDRRETRKAETVKEALITMDSWNPQIGLFWQYAKDHQFHATVARKSRMPSIKERFSVHMADDRVAIPNPGLKAEQAIHYEIGYQGNLFAATHLTTNLFYSRIDDKIESQIYKKGDYPGYPDQSVRQAINVKGVVERKGVELGVDSYISEVLSFGASYTWMQIKDLDNPSNHLTDVPRHAGSFYADIRPFPWLGIIPSVETNSARYINQRGDRLAGFALTNLKLSFTPPELTELTVNIGVKNLLNADARYHDTEYPADGRSYYGNLRITF
ncbi:Fe(3+)-pyochelin receptor [Mixta intestinalis]|uniref:Fe(3+)-pyochelin receptor n=2 Tax=Mixta intestinalis TaxID=1615494 RepID=A0A6P1Q3R9_9GAMM|nr:Fe(3+)-pyochelin receptor [Mixta intestinalis]